MPTTILKVNAAFPPDQGKKFGAVLGIDSSGQKMRLGVPGDSIPLFQKGGTYTIDYDVVPGNKPGVSFFNFLRMGDQPVSGMQPVSAAAGSAISEAQKLRERAEALEKAEQQKTQALTKIHDDETLKAAQIFVTGVVGRAAGNGLAATDLKGFALAAVDAWNTAQAALHGRLQPSTVAAGGAPVGPVRDSENPGAGLDLNDEIGF